MEIEGATSGKKGQARIARGDIRVHRRHMHKKEEREDVEDFFLLGVLWLENMLIVFSMPAIRPRRMLCDSCLN